MTRFEHFVALCRLLESTGGRLEKRRLVVEFLRTVAADEIGTAILFLTGRAFPPSDPRVLGVRGVPRVDAPTVGEPLTLADVAAGFAAVADASGAGSRRVREDRLRD